VPGTWGGESAHGRGCTAIHGPSWRRASNSACELGGAVRVGLHLRLRRPGEQLPGAGRVPAPVRQRAPRRGPAEPAGPAAAGGGSTERQARGAGPRRAHAAPHRPARGAACTCAHKERYIAGAHTCTPSLSTRASASDALHSTSAAGDVAAPGRSAVGIAAQMHPGCRSPGAHLAASPSDNAE